MPVENEIPIDVCPHCGHRHGGIPTPIGDWVCPRCDMTQRYPYWPQWHGNYYFRPYHMQRVVEQREIATYWGEDPRNPYGHLVFDRVYEQLRADEAKSAEQLPPSEGTPVSPPLPSTNPGTSNGVTPKPLPKKNSLPDVPMPLNPEPNNDRQGSQQPLKLKLAR
jgi:hypothetical protein